MKAPISNLKDPDMQAAPTALMRAAEKARRLAERTGTPFVVRQTTDISPHGDHHPLEENPHDSATTPTPEQCRPPSPRIIEAAEQLDTEGY